MPVPMQPGTTRCNPAFDLRQGPTLDPDSLLQAVVGLACRLESRPRSGLSASICLGLLGTSDRRISLYDR